ncbi:formate dehydrogenase subunit alpha [Heliorestis convoluta]|uniref:formate dehydrogenase subunit alpha n=1 Tax=Heliorestis convoluta TaxID=356322 RepID=UPI001A9BDBF4|nr:formate dehydrogenase subunit alpha [Heliorestis convoluta]
MQDITITINGQQQTVSPGMTVLQVARKLNLEIPTLCHDPFLSNQGSCRLCVVTVIDGKTNEKRLEPACVTPVQPGFIIETDSEDAIEARKTILELLLANHPNDCLRCEKAGHCALQQYAYEYGVDFPAEQDQGKKNQYASDDSNPFIERHMTKCILCGKCVTICQEEQGRHVLDYAYRGFATKVVSEGDGLLQDSPCVFCGACLQVCPTGALIDKTKKGKARSWEIEKVPTLCPYCGTGCTIELEVVQKKGVREVIAASAPSHGGGIVNGRSLCAKGRFGMGFIHHPERLTKPLIRKNGKLIETTWEEAFSTIAKKFKDLLQAEGPDAFAFLASARTTNEENYLLNKISRAVIGTNNIDHCARLCHSASVAGLAAAFGSGAMTNPIKDIEKSDTFLVLGSNTTETHPVIAQQMIQAIKKGSQAIVIDPRKTEIAQLAQEHIQIKAGTDLAFLNSLAHVIIEEKLYNNRFVEERTENFKALAAAVAPCTPQWAAEITGLRPEQIIAVARAYSRAKKAAIYYTMGITQRFTGTYNVMAIANLALLTGHIGRPGTGVNPLRGQNNVQGACDMGALPDVYPGYQAVQDEKIRRKMASLWAVEEEKLSIRPGCTVGEMIDGAAEGTIKAMFIMGENPVLADANSSHVVKALQKLDILVVADIFLTETAELAHVVLPAASFAEKEGTFTNTERRVQSLHKAIEQRGEARPDWKILTELSCRLGYPMNYESPAEILEEINLVNSAYGGITPERLHKEGSLCWPCPSSDHPGTARLHEESFSRGKGKFHGVPYLGPAEEPCQNYPYILSTGRRLFHYHGGSMTRRGALHWAYPEEHLEMHPKDGAQEGLRTGDLVTLHSRRGAVTLPVYLTEGVAPGLVFSSFHFRESRINELTNGARDPIAKIPELKHCAVRIEKEKDWSKREGRYKRILV